MNIKISIILIALLGSTIGDAIAGKNKTTTPGLASKALINKDKQKDVKWTGIVVQTANSSSSTCFQIAETVQFEGKKPKYDVLKDDSRFIACTSGHLKDEDYKGRLLTVTGDIEYYYNENDENGEFPIVKISGLKIWEAKKLHPERYSYIHSSRDGTSYRGRRGGGHARISIAQFSAK